MNNRAAISYFESLFSKKYPARNEYLKLAIDALEKQTPKKPKHTKLTYGLMDFFTSECPYCAENNWKEYGIFDRLVDEGRNYCWRCGQRIDWSEGGTDRNDTETSNRTP